MKQLTPFTLALFVAAVIITGGFFVLIVPELKQIGQGLAEQEYILTSSRESEAVSAATNKQKDELVDEAALVQDLLPVDSEPYDLAVQVEAWAKSQGVVLSSLQVNPALPNLPATTSQQAQEASAAQGGAASTGEAAGLLTTTLSVSASGSYQSLQEFILGLTRLQRFIEVQSLNFSSKEGATVTVQVNAVAYSQP